MKVWLRPPMGSKINPKAKFNQGNIFRAEGKIASSGKGQRVRSEEHGL